MSEHPVRDWETSIENEGPDVVEGVSGIDIDVSSRVGALVEDILQGLATNPNLKEATPSLIADAVLKGLSNHGLTKENIIAYFESAKK